MAGVSLPPAAMRHGGLGSTRPCQQPGLGLFAPRPYLSAPAWRPTERPLGHPTQLHPAVDPLSLDEAYLDVTGATTDGTLAVDLAREILDRIQRETGLTASAGTLSRPHHIARNQR